jgi:hypothetical protein
VQVEFLGQPFDAAGQLGRRLKTRLADAQFNRLWIAVAWAKRSGLSRIAGALTAFKDRGGDSEAIIGIDEGGATWEGLEMSLELFTRGFIYHHRGHTFHNKFYVVEGDNAAEVLIGSSNSTKGGFFTNYESAAAITLDKGIEADRHFLQTVRDYYEHLKAQQAVCKALDRQLMDAMAADSTLVIVHEALANRERGKRKKAVQGNQSVFGMPGIAMAGAPNVSPGQTEEGDANDDDDQASLSNLGVAVPSAGESFYKELSPSDVSTHDSPGQIIIPIGFGSFFPALDMQKNPPDVFFAVEFRDGGYSTLVTARLILYVPKPGHPRPNPDLRYTFRNREILEDHLHHRDILVFTKTPAGLIQVNRQPPGSYGPPRFAWLP